MSYALIRTGNGVVSHENADVEKLNLPDDAEIIDDEEAYRERLAELTE